MQLTSALLRQLWLLNRNGEAELRPRNTEPMILPEVIAHAELTMAIFFRGSSLRCMASVSGCDTARLLSVGRE
jgi:hypothetical protein